MLPALHLNWKSLGSALRDPQVPEKRHSELEDIPDVLSEGRRLEPFSPRYVRHFAESDLLNLFGELLPFCLIGRAHPVGDELLELRTVRPAEPGTRACARHAEGDGGIDDLRPLPPRVKQVPAALIGRLLARPDNQVRRPLRRLEDDLEADRL